MKKKLSLILIIFFLSANSQDSYFPGKANWEVKSPTDFNYDSKKIQEDYIEILRNSNSILCVRLRPKCPLYTLCNVRAA